ncbi:MAG: DUF2889 domain-containing protein [Clostridiales bacterium]|jgi:hypothetical protein|nr:DUF2889 domain-containing protein [Clostridiales bacterium]
MSIFHRTIDIEIDEGKQGVLVLRTRLTDMYHDIILKLTVEVGKFIISDASVELKRTPHPDCSQIQALVQSMTGLQVGPGFTREVLSAMGGEHGCPNMVNLILLTAPLSMNAAAVLRQRQEGLSEAEMNSLWQEVLGGVCVAYKKDPGRDGRK